MFRLSEHNIYAVIDFEVGRFHRPPASVLAAIAAIACGYLVSPEIIKVYGARHLSWEEVILDLPIAADPVMNAARAVTIGTATTFWITVSQRLCFISAQSRATGSCRAGSILGSHQAKRYAHG